MRFARVRQFVFLALALALVLAGCGGTAPAETAPPVEPVATEAAETPVPETAAPAPVPTEAPVDALPEAEPPVQAAVGDDYFADAAFFGNSLVAGLDMFGGLDTADFFASTSASVVNADKKTPENIETDLTMLEALFQRQYGKIYILLGINEIGFEPDFFVELYGALLDRIAEGEPGAALCVMSLTPVTAKKSAEGETFSQARVLEYNRALREMAEARGCYYLDLVEPLAGPDGYLAEEESTDGIHLTRDKYPAWSQWLRTHPLPTQAAAETEAAVETVAFTPDLPEREPEPGWFDDAVFFGNSLIGGLGHYGDLGADFVASVGVNVADAGTHRVSEESSFTMLQAVLCRPRGKLYTLFGINELGFAPETFAEYYEALIDCVLRSQPAVKVYLMSMTPVTAQRAEQDQVYTVEQARAYDEAVYALARRRGWSYVDSTEALAGPDGFLPEDISTDDGVHLTKEGYLQWCEYLRRHY